VIGASCDALERLRLESATSPARKALCRPASRHPLKNSISRRW
jgi:hypothetical protein